MQELNQNRLLNWGLLSFLVFIAFIAGLFSPILVLLIPLFIEINYYILKREAKGHLERFSKENILILVYLAFNLLFSFIIGLSIPIMESQGKFNFALLMIPLLFILNIVILQRHQYYYKNAGGLFKEESEDKPTNVEGNKREKSQSKPVIEFEGKKYLFSINSLIILAIGSPLISYFIYLLFDIPQNYWLHEIVVKQTAFFLNLLFDMGATVDYNPVGKYHWSFNIPGRASIYFETFCTGIQAICVFAGIILCTPHSQDENTNRDIIWRKTKSLIISSIIFYVVNILRMLIQLELYYIGYAWADIHYSISAASSFIAAIIILLLHKWIPEFIISIIYIGTLITRPIKIKRKENLISSVKEENKVEIDLLRKYLRLNKKNYIKKIKIIVEKLGCQIEDKEILIPKGVAPKFISELKANKPFKTQLQKL